MTMIMRVSFCLGYVDMVALVRIGWILQRLAEQYGELGILHDGVDG